MSSSLSSCFFQFLVLGTVRRSLSTTLRVIAGEKVIVSVVGVVSGIINYTVRGTRRRRLVGELGFTYLLDFVRRLFRGTPIFFMTKLRTIPSVKRFHRGFQYFPCKRSLPIIAKRIRVDSRLNFTDRNTIASSTPVVNVSLVNGVESDLLCSFLFQQGVFMRNPLTSTRIANRVIRIRVDAVTISFAGNFYRGLNTSVFYRMGASCLGGVRNTIVRARAAGLDAGL